MPTRYPDPHAVVRPTTAPPPFPSQLVSRTVLADRPEARTIYPVHDHCAFVNPEGEGVTDVVAGHFHRVLNNRVYPDLSDGHTHNLTGLPCGAGSPTPNRAG